MPLPVEPNTPGSCTVYTGGIDICLQTFNWVRVKIGNPAKLPVWFPFQPTPRWGDRVRIMVSDKNIVAKPSMGPDMDWTAGASDAGGSTLDAKPRQRWWVQVWILFKL